MRVVVVLSSACCHLVQFVKVVQSVTCSPRVDFYIFVPGTATTDMYTSLHTLSLHVALPISESGIQGAVVGKWDPRSDYHKSELQSRIRDKGAAVCLTESCYLGRLSENRFPAAVTRKGDSSANILVS